MAACYQLITVFMLLTTTLMITNTAAVTNICLEASTCYDSLITDGHTTTNNQFSADNEKACAAFEKCVFNFDTKQQKIKLFDQVNSTNQSNSMSLSSTPFSNLICICSVIRNQFLLDETSSSFCQKKETSGEFEVEKACKRYAHLCFTTQEYMYENMSDHNPQYCALLLYCVPGFDIERMREMMVFPRESMTKRYCPYNDFCMIKSSQPGTNRCNSCSCDYDCGQTRSCCFKDLDTYNIPDDTAVGCQELMLDRGEATFYVVNMCADGSNCKASIVAPVTSLITYRIYINADCAECNCLPEQNYTVWESGVKCISDSPIPVDDWLTNYKCFDVVFPPHEHFDLIQRLACSDSLLNTTCKYVKHMENDCKRVWAPLFSNYRHRGMVYRNHICARCMDGISLPSEPEPQGPGRHGNNQFLVIIDHGVLDQYTRTGKRNGETCIQHQGLCRPVFCPEFAVRVDRTCHYIYKQWIHVSLSIQVRLRPVVHYHTLVQSSLDEMSEEEDLHKWLHPSCGIRFPDRGNLVHLYIRVFDSTESIIVRQIQILTLYLRMNIVPGEFIATLKDCFKNNWEVKLNGTTYPYTVELVGTPSINVEEELSELASDAPFDAIDKPTDEFSDTNETVHDTLGTNEEASVCVSKLFLCEQINLEPCDVKHGDGYIILLHNNKHLRKGEYKTITTVGKDFIVKVCIEDFLHGVTSSSAQTRPATLIFIIVGVMAIVI